MILQIPIASSTLTPSLLKNGAKIIGAITNREEGKSVTIVREDGLSFDVPLKKIAAITTMDELEAIHSRVSDSLDVSSYLEEDSRTLRTVRIGVMNGDDQTFFSISAGFGSRIGKHSFVGLGAGHDISSLRKFLPVFAEFRTYELMGDLPAYLLVQLGFSIGWIENFSGADHGGMMFLGGAAIDIPLNESWALSGLLGFRMQQSPGWRSELIVAKVGALF